MLAKESQQRGSEARLNWTLRQTSHCDAAGGRALQLKWFTRGSDKAWLQRQRCTPVGNFLQVVWVHDNDEKGSITRRAQGVGRENLMTTEWDVTVLFVGIHIDTEFDQSTLAVHEEREHDPLGGHTPKRNGPTLKLKSIEHGAYR
jgi:hypothetical protein